MYVESDLSNDERAKGASKRKKKEDDGHGFISLSTLKGFALKMEF